MEKETCVGRIKRIANEVIQESHGQLREALLHDIFQEVEQKIAISNRTIYTDTAKAMRETRQVSQDFLEGIRSDILLELERKLEKIQTDVYRNCDALYQRKDMTTITQLANVMHSRKSSETVYPPPVQFPYHLMLKEAINAQDPDSTLWRRLSHPKSFRWVSLTNPKGPLERHFTAKIVIGDGIKGKVSYEIWTPTMADMLAKDWVRV
jgi:hypothetical protein